MFKCTSRLLSGWALLALGTLAASGLLIAWLAPAAAEQPLGINAPAADKGEQLRQQAGDLVRRARTALADNDLATAEKLVAQAEAAGASYPLFYRGDTPQAVRRELEAKKKAAGPARPSLLAAPGNVKKAPTTDPFMGRVGGSILPGPNDVTPLPKVEPSPVRPLAANDPSQELLPFGRAGGATPGVGDLGAPAAGLPLGPYPTAGAALAAGTPHAPREAGTAHAPREELHHAERDGYNKTNQELLRTARRALAVRDVKRATTLVQQAKASPAQYDPLDDTPERVDLAIRKYQDVMAQQSNTEVWRRQYARVLMEQADALLRAGDVPDAEQLVEQADRQQLTYGAMESKPRDLMARIAAAKRAPSSAAAGVAFAGGDAPPAAALPTVPTAAPAVDQTAQRRQAVELVRQAREAMRSNQLARAETLAVQAEKMRLPDTAFPPADRPGLILLQVRQAKLDAASNVLPAAHQSVVKAAGGGDADRTASRAVYDPATDATRNVAAQAQLPYSPAIGPLAQGGAPRTGPTMAPTPLPPTSGGAASGPEGQGAKLLRQAEEARKAGQTERAYKLYREAAQHINELDPQTAQHLQDSLQFLAPKPAAAPPGGPRSLADEATAKQALLFRQVAADIQTVLVDARKNFEKDPKASIASLEELKQKVEASELDSATRKRFADRVDVALGEMHQAFNQNRPRIELDERNRKVRDDMKREQKNQVEVDQKLAAKIDEFNRLVDEQRFAEAEVVASQCLELAPEEPVAQQVSRVAKTLRRLMNSRSIASKKENGFVDVFDSVVESSEPFDDRNPFSFGDIKKWKDLTERRKLLAEHKRHRTERELEIERKLKSTLPALSYTNMPLAKLIGEISKMSGVNIHIDPKALSEQGVQTSTPVSIDLQQDIMLKSVLALVLEPLELSYVVKNEVLMITSQQARDGQVYTITYNVADLVTPIPNFVPNPEMGLGGAYRQAMANATMGNSMGSFGGNTPMAVVASRDGRQASAAINPNILAQQTGNPAMAAAAGNGMPQGGPGGMGGGPQADFDSLINLITSTVAPTTWDDVGGPGSIAPFETNLSIVVSQTQAVHEQIVDLLEQLRRLQDLQVTIEVRFLTLNDNFFERIGVDFDFNIDDNANQNKGWVQQFNSVQAAGGLPDIANTNIDAESGKNLTVGMSNPGIFSSDLDIPFRQNGFALAAPQFGGFDPTAGAQIGFAILSDIEAYFFINAAQGDRRTNVLQAPKVTLFNGQQAFISDSSTTPFVISVIPVVGDFAAAQQPVIVVLSEGTHMTVQAVVSNDRRFVRLTVVPFFSKIGEVNTFQFTGTETTTTDTSAEGWVNPLDPNNSRRNNNRNNNTRTRSGTAVQLPTFSYVTVTTTVSVPDGGTVLLGGIKRLSEGRNEFGVPILNKVPFINRLFKNVGIGRETQSLMMMVTPRIIIQEEEEQKLGIDTGT